jgi:predicted phage terminase large subunit-like protein
MKKSSAKKQEELSLDLQIRKLKLFRQLRIIKSRESFWEYCKTLAPDFYQEERDFLKEYATTLQALYEGRIVRRDLVVINRTLENNFGWEIIDKPLAGNVEIKNPGTENEISVVNVDGVLYEVCRKFMINIPPRFGKSRTLFMFCDWCFGQDNKNRVITCSYNDTISGEFSRYTRDGIAEKKNLPHEIVFSDIFPGTKLQHGNASFERWALEGQFFNYLGAGVGGTITGKGCNIGIIDDTVKGAEEAYNEGYLDKIWTWYTGTFKSRPEEGAIEILPGTRWSKKDIFGRILDSPTAHLWYVFKREAMDRTTGKMLCPSLMSRNRYEELKATTDSAIFEANYHQEPVDIKGRLYSDLKEYLDIPRNSLGHPIFERIINYTDTADEGKDKLCSIVAGEYRKEAYILDVYFTAAGMEITEPKTAALLFNNKVQFALIESNNGGRGFARNVQRELWEKFKSRFTVIRWFHQSDNKIARILANSSFVINHVYFPKGWDQKWPEFYKVITTFQKEGTNLEDDAPDALTGIAEVIQGKRSGNISSETFV